MRIFKPVFQKRQLRLSLLCLILLTACAPSQGGDPAAAVTAYLNAMVADDTAKLPQLVCPAYESGAQTDFDSLGAIGGVTLNHVQCTTASTSGDTATVTCTGSLDFTYNGDSNSQDLSGNTYSVTRVDGEWKMCGYQ